MSTNPPSTCATTQQQAQTCLNPEECCRELTRVWEVLGLREYNGKSASENVADLKQLLPQKPDHTALVARLEQAAAYACSTECRGRCLECPAVSINEAITALRGEGE